jgi:uncharacterized membrane protein
MPDEGVATSRNEMTGRAAGGLTGYWYGARLGMLIPFPVLGSFLGGVIGALVGSEVGRPVGRALGNGARSLAKWAGSKAS